MQRLRRRPHWLGRSRRGRGHDMSSFNEKDFPTFSPRYSLSLSLSPDWFHSHVPRPNSGQRRSHGWGIESFGKKSPRLCSAILTRRRFDDEHHEDPLAEGARAVLLVVATRPHVKGQNLKLKRGIKVPSKFII